MPKVSVWMLRLSLIYFSIGGAFGALLLADKAYHFAPFLWDYRPAHMEILIFGWIIQFTMGTAYWILPRFLIRKDRGNKWAAYFMPILLNIGIWTVVVGEVIENLSFLGWVGRLLEIFAVILFAALHWRRIVTYAHHKD